MPSRSSRRAARAAKKKAAAEETVVTVAKEEKSSNKNSAPPAKRTRRSTRGQGKASSTVVTATAIKEGEPVRTRVTAEVAPAPAKVLSATVSVVASPTQPKGVKKAGDKSKRKSRKGAAAGSKRSKPSKPTGPSDGSLKMRKWNCEDIQNRRKGKWGKTESKTLMDALYAEAKAAGIEPSDLCGNLAARKTQLQNAATSGTTASDVSQIWHKIASAVPQRTMRSCYYHAEAKLKASTGKSGKWSKEEKDQLEELVKTHGPKWTVIGKILNRYSVSCKDCYRRISLKKTTKTGEWTPEENDKLIKLVMQHHDDEDVANGKKDYPTKNIHWRTIATEMNGRNEYQCCNSWYQRLHGKVSRVHHWSADRDLELLKAIARTGAKDATEIPWTELPFKSTTVVLKRRFRSALKLPSLFGPQTGPAAELSFKEQLDAAVRRIIAKKKKQAEKKEHAAVAKIEVVTAGVVTAHATATVVPKSSKSKKR